MKAELKQLIELDTMILNTSIKDLLKQSDLIFLHGWQYGRLGGFDSLLSKAMSHADGSNIIRMYKGFPDKVIAMRAYQIKEGYWQEAQNEIDNHD